MQAVSLRFSPALWRRGRGANLKPRLSQAASLATERPPRNMRLSLHPSLPRESTYKSTYKPLRNFGVETKCEFPQGLKPNSPRARNGTAEAVPLQSLLLLLPKQMNDPGSGPR